MTYSEKQDLLNTQWNIINENKEKLTSMDYIGIKIAMGVAQIEDYADVIEKTKNWRKAINNAEEEVKKIEAMEIEENPIEPLIE